VSIGFQLARDYEKGTLCGWGEIRQPGIVKAQFNLLESGFLPFHIRQQTKVTAGRKMFLYQVVRKILGQDTKNYPQEIGDCVSFGAKNGTEYLTCTQIASVAQSLYESGGDYQSYLANARIKFRSIFPPWFYGTGRVYVGGGRLGNEDGSLGSWMAAAVQKYGALFSDDSNVPAYSGRIAKAWGDPNPRNDLDNFKDVAKQYLVKGAALIRSWDDLVAALCNGYPCPTASNIGYGMEPGRDGFHVQNTQWGHQMCFIGADDNDKDPYALIVNSWGDVHGHLKDFESGEDLPVGVLRVRRRDAEKHIQAQETFAYSAFDGFPEQGLDKALFMLV